MIRVLPGARPQLPREAAEKLLAAYGIAIDRCVILGERGYFRDTMGEKGKNDRGIFDDALVIISPRTYRTFNGNTDPSTKGGRLAVLQPGAWQMKRGIHHPGTPGAYKCLVQAGPVTVLRDNGVKETGEFYIHVHHAGFNTTTSAGCQTVYMGQWDEFRDLYEAEMDFYKQDEITYVLTVNEDAP
jgi:lysozyme